MVISRGILLKGLIGSLAFAGGSLGVVLASRGKNKDDTNSNEVEQDSGSIPQDKNDRNPNVGEGQGTPEEQSTGGPEAGNLVGNNPTIQDPAKPPLNGDGKVGVTTESSPVALSVKTPKVIRPAETTKAILGIPKSCFDAWVSAGSGKHTCELVLEEFKAIKFETKGGSSISLEGGFDEKEHEIFLTIVDLFSNDPGDKYNKGKKYIFETSSETATIKNAKDNEDITITKNDGASFKATGSGENDKLVFVEMVGSEKVDSLGIPIICQADQVTKDSPTEKSCELTAEQLKKVKFEGLGDTGTTTVTGLTAPNNKITLTISWEGDNSTYPDNKKYSFDNSTNNSEIKITRSQKSTTIAKKSKSLFKNEKGKLVLVKTESSQ